eukprot:c16428_g1_i1.p1 GENE.c16428_g1_i1~~c16428_g1_i1.p1  ORF type:complete len:141 (+),score=24.32 c16428_g1_i1:846-1268(+)
MTEAELGDIASVVTGLRVDGIIVSNTTISRPAELRSAPEIVRETGGLSGKPLFGLSTQTLRSMYRLTEGKIPLIAVGGVASAEDAYEKIRCGASLVQVYSALVYQGFGLVPDIKIGLADILKRDGFSHVSEAIGIDAINR